MSAGAVGVYLFVNETRGSEHLVEAQLPALLRGTLAGLLPLLWSTGRVLLIGDAVHSTTPHLASGAGIGIEYAIVLADEVGRGASVAEVVARHEQRRWERCRLVVENSRRLGEIEQGQGAKEAHTALMRASQEALAQPI